ncbi:MAG: hypothetical protein U0271_27305 [Polyangiaceae bacterium]
MLRRGHASWLRFASFLALITAGCSAQTPPERGVGSGQPQTSAAASSSASSGLAPGYEVHEWGLVRAEPAGPKGVDKVRIGGVAPPVPPEIFIVTKPVLYFRADAPMTLKSVTVRAPGGTIPETWPLATPGSDEHTVEWTDVSIDPLSACPFSRLPRKTDPPCSKLAAGEECESLGLAAVRSVDASCVRVAGKTDSYLFYRITTDALTPPLRFKRGEDGRFEVTNEGDEAVPGTLLRIETTQARTRTLSVRPPAPHRTIVVGQGFPTSEPGPAVDEQSLPIPRVVVGTGREDLRASLREQGLAETEIDAFMKTWDETLFGSPSTGGFRPIQPGTSFLYFLPEAMLERAAQVTFDPPPRAIRRACAVWTQAGP